MARSAAQLPLDPQVDLPLLLFHQVGPIQAGMSVPTEVWNWVRGGDQLIFGRIHLRGLTDCDTDVSEESQKVNDL